MSSDQVSNVRVIKDACKPRSSEQAVAAKGTMKIQGTNYYEKHIVRQMPIRASRSSE